MLTVQGLRKSFPAQRAGDADTVAVDDVSLVVQTGTFASVLGPSGSGKTTLLRCIAGFERPDAGTITLRGRELVSTTTMLRAYERGVGIVPQEGALFPHLSVSQNIGFGLHRSSRHARRDRVDSLLALVGLAGLGARRPDQLSGGQQQRVALARALAPEPDLILLDEPFSALDAQLRVELRDEVRELLRSVGSTVVLVTHDQSEAMSMADHLVVMRNGRVVAASDPRTVYDRPADTQLGRFLGEALVLPGQVGRGPEGLLVVCALGELQVGHWHGEEGRCQVLVRPEQISALPVTGAPNGTGVVGTVSAQSYFGHDALIRVRVPGLEQPVPVRVPGGGRYLVGDLAELHVAAPVSTYPEPITDA